MIDCEPDKTSIVKAIKIGLSNEFLKKTKSVINPYGNGGASEKICDMIKSANLKDIIFKEFYQI